MEDINIAMQTCFKNELKVYPICKDGFWYIQATYKTVPYTFKKKLSTSKEVNDALVKSYFHYADKINNE